MIKACIIRVQATLRMRYPCLMWPLLFESPYEKQKFITKIVENLKILKSSVYFVSSSESSSKSSSTAILVWSWIPVKSCPPTGLAPVLAASWLSIWSDKIGSDLFLCLKTHTGFLFNALAHWEIFALITPSRSLILFGFLGDCVNWFDNFFMELGHWLSWWLALWIGPV